MGGTILVAALEVVEAAGAFEVEDAEVMQMTVIIVWKSHSVAVEAS